MKRIKWEYKTRNAFLHEMNITLNHWGEEGWELICMTCVNLDLYTLVFKRKKNDKAN